VVIVDERRELHGGELSLVAAIAVRDAVASCTEIVPTIKWPNDVLVSGRKLGGILVEARVYHNEVQAYVVGLGINCLQQKGHIPVDLAEKATSLELESRQGIDRDAVAIAVLQELDRWLAAPGAWTYETLRREWLTRCEPMGRRVVLRQAGKVYSGSMLDIDPTAALVVKLDEGGIRAFNAADTTIVDC
jgi:BirA family biotin operon repressor/biotin-[acetyl-CoA-carboxylase] ligase